MSPVPVVREWSRQHTTVDTTSGGRLALGGGFTAVGATLERVIFGWHIYQDTFYSGRTTGPEHTSLVGGVIFLPAASGPPTVDPVSSPGSDWLWVGVLPARLMPLRFASAEEYRVVFESPVEQMETSSRRRGPATDFGAVWLVTNPLSTLNSQMPRWRGSSFISALYSFSS